MNNEFEASLDFSLRKDREDALAAFRKSFYFPQHGEKNAIYFCGNSLGLQPKNTAEAIQQELADWNELAIGGYTRAKTPWLFYQQYFQKSLAQITGCLEEEVTVMNTLTVNLHLMMLSFYRPTKTKYKILMEAGAFPSDQYAVETQVRFYGFEPEDAIIEVHPPDNKKLIEETDILALIDAHKDELALVLLGGINYYSGQLFNMKTITEEAHKAGAVAGFDLAHVAGNVPVQLHDWNVDFAVWCSYKYLNAGPGAAGGVFIHERHVKDKARQRMGGWWGNAESTRFNMEKGFIPKPEANGWNISTAQVFNMVCLKASLEWFDKAGMDALRIKSISLTGFLEFLLTRLNHLRFEVITPREPECRGAQLSLYFPERGKEIHEQMTRSGIIVDYREPGVIRVAPAPMYNSFEDVFRFYGILSELR